MSSFNYLVAESPVEAISRDSRLVFMSDFHLGDGGTRDDLVPNRGLVQNALAKWYFEKGYTLVLNGDIEDLSKFRWREIRPAWAGLYEILDAFHAAGRLRKILGNHDLGLISREDYPYPLTHSLTLDWKGHTIFAFHGHQASRFFMKYDYLSDIVVRYLAKPLAIRNTSVSHDSRYRYNTERLIYRASRRLGLLSITGHTHRPLFESLSKHDSLRFEIEGLLREYPKAKEARKSEIGELVDVYRRELERVAKKEKRRRFSGSLYGRHDFLVPSLFNSGCATGKKGVTALELEDDSIALVQWTGVKGPRTYVESESSEQSRLENTPYSRYVMRRSRLDEVFARIELLGND
jgi:predicted phosphodiesterase